MDISNKAERAFADYLAANISGLTIRRARQGGPPLDGPLLLVHSEGIQSHPDLPPADGTYLVQLALTIMGVAAETAAPASPLDQISCALLDVSGAQSFINGTAYQLHLHDLDITGQTAGEDNQSRPTHTVTVSATLTNAAA